MAVYEIPLSPQPQRFNITLNGRNLSMTVQYRAVSEGGWILDIDDADGAAILHGIPLVTGSDLLGQYAYLGLGGQMIVQTDTDIDAVPAWDSLGTTAHLYFVMPD